MVVLTETISIDMAGKHYEATYYEGDVQSLEDFLVQLLTEMDNLDSADARRELAHQFAAFASPSTL